MCSSKHPTESSPSWSCGCGQTGVHKETFELHTLTCPLYRKRIDLRRLLRDMFGLLNAERFRLITLNHTVGLDWKQQEALEKLQHIATLYVDAVTSNQVPATVIPVGIAITED